jgi:hypothetical protein
MNLKIVKITNDRAYGFCPFHNDTKPSFEVKLTGEHYGEYFCYDKETEVLTDQGWKKFSDLNKTEKIYSLNPNTNETFYQKPIAYQEIYYKGGLINFSGRRVDLLVTPDHNMFYKEVKQKNYHLGSALEASKYYSISLQNCGIWKGIDPEFFYCPPVKEIQGKKIKKVGVWKMEDYVQFMGWYLSEGYVLQSEKGRSRYRIGISQDKKHDNYCKQIEELLNRLHITWHRTGRQYGFYSKQLHTYLSQFGYSRDKYIPQEIKEMSPRLLQLFLDSYCKGDGHKHSCGWTITTTSRRMADDLQEIIFKAGYSSSIYNNNKRYNHNNCFNVSMTKKTDFSIFSKHKIKQYEGMVYDVTLPQHHVLFVRRNGKAVWSGNCYGCGRTGTLAQVAMDTLLARKKSKPSINKKVTPINWDNLNGKYGMTYFFDADKLGKPFECSRMSLNHLHCGWDGAFTFPMRNGNNEIIGIQRRFSDGKKINVEGSRLGLFIPQTVNNTGRLFICEGASDTATMLDMGFFAIGRPNSSYGDDFVNIYIASGQQFDNIYIVADNDKSGVGLKGAKHLSLELKLDESHIIMPPYKDIREMFINVGTYDTTNWILENIK